MEVKSRMLYGSINVSELIDQLKKAHSGFTKASNGKIYANVRVWLNEEQDQFQNDASIQITAKQDTGFANFYIGNMKFSITKESGAINAIDIDNLNVDEDDLPF